MCSKRGMDDTTTRRFAECSRRRRRPAWVTAVAGAVAAAAVVAVVGLGAGLIAAAEPPLGEVRLVDHAELMATVASHRGRVVVLDCWSTSCPPCLREFPGLVALARRHPDVVCLSLSFDYEGIGRPEDALPRVRTFLEQVAAGPVHNLLSREESDVMARRLDIASVPAVFVWGPDGALVRRFDDDSAARQKRPFTYADVEAEVRRLRQP